MHDNHQLPDLGPGSTYSAQANFDMDDEPLQELGSARRLREIEERLAAAEARTRELEATVRRVKAVADDVARYTRLDGSEVAVQLDTALWGSDD